MNARIPMSARSQVAVADALARLTGTTDFPGVLPAALTPETAWRLGKRSGYTALELPSFPSASRAVLAFVTTDDGRSSVVIVTPSRVISRVKFPTVDASFFRGTILDGHATSTTFTITDVIANRGRRTCGMHHPGRLELAWQFIMALVSRPTGTPPTSELALEVAQGRTLEQLADHAHGTHLLVPEDRTFPPGRLQPDTFLISFAGLAGLLRQGVDEGKPERQHHMIQAGCFGQ